MLEAFEGDRLRLREGADQVLLLPVAEIDAAPLGTLVGRVVEVVGVARRLPERQAIVPCWDVEHARESWCEDQELAPLPDRSGYYEWPRNSVSFWAIVDATPFEHRRDAPGSELDRLVSEPARFDGQEVRVVGQYRGANLFGDLPESTRRGSGDWVIADGAAAVWVTGKPPQGEGWRLSLSDPGDTRWWVEVRGRVEVVGGVAYLRAKKLTLRRAP